MWSGISGWPDGAQQDRVAGLQQVDRVGRHHAAPAEEVLGAPIEILKREGDVVLPGDALQDPLGLRNDFRADAVAGDHADRKSFHGFERNCSGDRSVRENKKASRLKGRPLN